MLVITRVPAICSSDLTRRTPIIDQESNQQEQFHKSTKNKLFLEFDGLYIVPKHIIKRTRGENDKQGEASEDIEVKFQ